MTEEEIKKIEDNCKIKSKEQFVQNCLENNIPAEWYSFKLDKTKPVCFEGNTVYYGKIGQSTCTVSMCIWDVGFRELLAYKKEYECEISGEEYRITEVYIKTNEFLSNKQESLYPDVLIEKDIPSEKPSEAMISDGWVDGGYDYYMGYYRYSKIVDLRTILNKVQIRFKKKTDARDKTEFGFADEYMQGSYTYDIPTDMLEEIAKELHSVLNVKKDPLEPHRISESLKGKIIDRLAGNIIEDEYKALILLRDTHKKALFDAIDNNLTEREQKNQWASISRLIELKNPAALNVWGCRCHQVTEHNYNLVYEETSISR